MKISSNDPRDVITLRRRSSVFEPLLSDNVSLKKSLFEFVASQKDNLSTSNAPFTWERLFTGYRIVDFQFDRAAEAMDLLKMYYLCTNHACAVEILDMDVDTTKSYQEYILNIVSDGNSFFALEEGSNEIVGVAVSNSISSMYVPDEEDMGNLIKFERELLDDALIYETYDVDEYFCVHIICVRTDHHGKGIGDSLIRACLSRARKYRYPVCIGIFPEGPSQTIARRFGFEILSEKSMTNVKVVDINDENNYLLDTTKFEDSFVTCMGTVICVDKEEEEEKEEVEVEVLPKEDDKKKKINKK